MGEEQTIDQLNIEINTEAKQSSSGMDKLISSIEKLKSVTGGGVGELTGIAASLSKLTSAIDGMKGKSGSVSSLANSIKKLNDLKTDQVSSNINTLTESLKTLSGMDPELKTMISDLAALSKSGNGSVAENALSLQAAAAKAQATIDQSALKSAKAQEGLKAIAEKNQQIEETARQAAAQEQELTDSINAAIQQHVKQYGSAGAFSNSAADLGAVMPDYGKETSNWPKNVPSEIDTESINSLKSAMGEVGETAGRAMNEVSEGTSRASGFVDKLKNSFNSAKEKLYEIGNSSNSFFSMGRFYGWYFILRQIADTFGGMINNINDYIENMNLFDVAMGKSAQSGEKLAKSLQSVLGVDSGEAMRYMGVFEQMTTSFGIANKQATTMSENLTQLGYDIASFYNISTSKSFDKLEAGISGQSRALRELGIDTSTARLQQELYNLGFKEKVKDLTEADKAELRYIAIMKQTTNAQGDMARTIQTPANALRVLQAQFAITGRAIGSIFIPALEAILPPVTVVIEIIGDLASELASLLGFKLPKIDYSSLNTGLSGIADDAGKASTGLGNVGDSASNAGKKAKKAKEDLDNLISGFDELHILQKTKDDSDSTGSTGKSGTGADGGNILGGIDLPSYNALAGAIGNSIDGLKKKILDFLEAFKNDPLTTFANALWGVDGAFGQLGKWLSMLDYADILNGIAAATMAYGLTKNPLLALAIGAVATAVSHLFPEKSKIDLLDGSLIALGGALVLKAFTGMPFKLALGISTLLESGLIELIGKDNAIDLLTSSLTGLGIGMLTFSFTGNLPLAIAIGAVSAAISGLAIHFSDLQIAPALLAGVTAGLLAFKLGMDSWSAGAVGLGVAITSFAELNQISPELRAGLLGLSGAVTALGLAFQMGFGPEGLIISAVVGALIGLGAGLIQAAQDEEKADLAKRFGSITLSAQECEDVAKRLTKTPWTVKIDAAIDANDKLKDLEKNIESDVNTLNKLNWKVSIGMQLTKGEISDYKETISSFISDAKSYIQQQQYSVTLAINASYAPGSETQKNLIQFVNTYYGNAQRQLDSLGKQLSDEVNKAFSDGILTEGEYLKISSIEQKMQKIIDKISDAEYKAKLDNLTADVSEKGLTADSFKDLQAQIQKTAQDRLSKADQVRLKATAAAELKLDEDGNKAEYNKAIAELQETYNQQKATIDLTGLSVSLNTLKSKFKNEISTTKPMLESSVKDMFSSGLITGYTGGMNDFYKQNAGWMAQKLSGYYNKEIKNANISSTARAEISELVAQLQPTENDLKQIAAAAKNAGKAVPENVAKGISDVEQLKAINNDGDAINYMVGKKLSTDSSFIATLATAKDAGKSVDAATAQGLADNLPFVKDSATGTIIGIKNSITGKTDEITPTLRQNLKDMGIDIVSNGLVSGVNSKVPDANTSGSNVVQGLWDGMSSKKKKMDPWVVDMSKGILKTFNDQNEIHSPSKAFERSGGFLIQGLWDGMSSTWDKLTSWWSSLKLLMPKITWVSGGWQASGWIYDVLNTLHLPTQLPTLDVKWCANGGVFGGKSIIGVGEYPDAASNPEVVAPQSIIRETVSESNEGLAAAFIVAAQQIVEAIEKKDTSLNVDGKTVAKTVNKVNSNQGYNLGLKST